MKREEREQLLKDTLLYFAPKDRYVTDEEGNVYYREDVTLKAMELSEQPLPPAEGAKKVQWSGYGELGNISQKPLQPTAEGAEEILDKYPHSTEYPSFIHENSAIAAMHEFATLHAQKIADKMVSERLIEFGEMIRDEPNGDIAALAEYFIRTINLKTREK